MTKKFKVAVVGATGMVGAELVEALAARRFPVEALKLFASLNTAGEKVPFLDDEVRVEPITADYGRGLDIVFFAAHPMISRDLAENAVKEGAMVIDSSRAFRDAPGVPMVAPELNPEDLAGVRTGRRIVVNPSAAAVAAGLVAGPLHRRWGLRRLVAVTIYGSASSGRAGLAEHQNQTIGMFNQEELSCQIFGRQSAFNLFPRVGEFVGDATEAEADLESDLPRLLKAEIKVAATAAQAPYFCGTGAALNLEFEKEPSAEEAREILRGAPAVAVLDDPAGDEYPDTVESMSRPEVLVGRIRKDPSHDRGLQLWVSADNLRKGSAVNMVQIAEELIKDWK